MKWPTFLEWEVWLADGKQCCEVGQVAGVKVEYKESGSSGPCLSSPASDILLNTNHYGGQLEEQGRRNIRIGSSTISSKISTRKGLRSCPVNQDVG